MKLLRIKENLNCVDKDLNTQSLKEVHTSVKQTQLFTIGSKQSSVNTVK